MTATGKAQTRTDRDKTFQRSWQNREVCISLAALLALPILRRLAWGSPVCDSHLCPELFSSSWPDPTLPLAVFSRQTRLSTAIRLCPRVSRQTSPTLVTARDLWASTRRGKCAFYRPCCVMAEGTSVCHVVTRFALWRLIKLFRMCPLTDTSSIMWPWKQVIKASHDDAGLWVFPISCFQFETFFFFFFPVCSPPTLGVTLSRRRASLRRFTRVYRGKWNSCIPVAATLTHQGERASVCACGPRVCVCVPCLPSPFEVDSVTQTVSQKVFWSFLPVKGHRQVKCLGEPMMQICFLFFFPFTLAGRTPQEQKWWFRRAVVYSGKRFVGRIWGRGLLIPDFLLFFFSHCHLWMMEGDRLNIFFLDSRGAAAREERSRAHETGQNGWRYWYRKEDGVGLTWRGLIGRAWVHSTLFGHFGAPKKLR